MNNSAEADRTLFPLYLCCIYDARSMLDALSPPFVALRLFWFLLLLPLFGPTFLLTPTWQRARQRIYKNIVSLGCSFACLHHALTLSFGTWERAEQCELALPRFGGSRSSSCDR